MCGIVAIHSARAPVQAAILQQAMLQLRHRGPDQQRYWINSTGSVGLGHTRLSIIDLETGEQPIANEDGRLRVIVNGEFYGYQAIQDQLEDRGHYLRTRSDSEIVLHLYEELGTQCLAQLRGEFAFALWDENNQVLFAARDRFGIKPLFYAYVGDVLYMASEIKALFTAGVPACWDQEALYQHLSLCLDQDRTLFKGIFQVPPGHYLLATRYRVQLIRYWDLDYPPDDQLSTARDAQAEADAIEQLRYHLNEAVQLRMNADVPVGCFLSGGIDSSTILGMACQQSAQSVQAFTVAFNHPAYDEEPIAARTAHYAGASYQSISVTQEDFAENIEEVIWHAEMLGHNAHAIARYIQSRVVHDAGYKVVLSGDGADEVFAGYIYSRLDFLLNNLDQLSESARQRKVDELCRNNPAFRSVLAAREQEHTYQHMQRRINGIPGWLRSMLQSRAAFQPLYARDFQQAFQTRDMLRLFLDKLDVSGQLEGRNPFVQALYIWAKSFLPNQVLFADRMEMAHSVEVRMPFLDHHVFEFVRTLPPHLLIHNDREKYILREAARPYITDEIYSRPKHPFTAPHATLDLNNRFYTTIQDILRGSICAAVPFFDHQAIIDLLDSLPKMPYRQRIAYDQILLMLLGICLLQKTYRVGTD